MTSVDIVRRSYDAFARDDLDGVMADMDEQIEWHRRRGFRTAAPTVGSARCGGTSSLLCTTNGGRSFSAERDEFVDAGETVVVLGRYRGVAKRTGRRLDVPYVHVWTLRDGTAVRFWQFLDTQGWNDALGLGPAGR